MFIEQKIVEIHRELFGVGDIDNCNSDVLLKDIINHLREYNIVNISFPELILMNEDTITEEDAYEYEKFIKKSKEDPVQ